MDSNSTSVVTGAFSGAVTDVWVLIALIIPGFILFRVLTWLVAYEVKFEQFTITIYSLICSLIVFLPVALLNNFQSLDDLRIRIINPMIMFELLGFGGLFGFIPGIFIKLTLRKQYKFGSPWDNFANDYLTKAIVLYTNDDRQYIGWVKRMSRGRDDKKEIALGDPQLVKREANGTIRYIPQGDEMLFTEDNIKRILRRLPPKKE